ncbi:MAG TPA: hypothetical protein VGD78_06230 [Chthoniobacterales bacterium]
MKTAGINALRAMVAEALTKEDGEKLAEAMVRATELAEDEVHPVTRDHLDKRFAELKSDLVGRLNSQTLVLVTLMFVQPGRAARSAGAAVNGGWAR